MAEEDQDVMEPEESPPATEPEEAEGEAGGEMPEAEESVADDA